MRDKKNKNLRGLVMRQTRRHPRDVDGKAFIFRRKQPQKAQLVSQKYGTHENRKKAPYSQVKRSPDAKETTPKRWHPRDYKRKRDPYSRVKESPEATETALRNLVVRMQGTLGILDVLRYTWTENNESQNKTKLSAVLRKKIPFSVYEGKITGFCGIFSHW